MRWKNSMGGVLEYSESEIAAWRRRQELGGQPSTLAAFEEAHGLSLGSHRILVDPASLPRRRAPHRVMRRAAHACIGLVVLTALVGCDDPAVEQALPPAAVIELGDPHTNRFSVQHYGKFWGGYQDHVRAIFVVTDRKTGVEYLAITGCGTTELMTEHRRSGKHTSTVTVEE